jgi:hypothetical protein
LLGECESADHIANRGGAIEHIALIDETCKLSPGALLLGQNEDQVSLLIGDELFRSQGVQRLDLLVYICLSVAESPPFLA